MAELFNTLSMSINPCDNQDQELRSHCEKRLKDGIVQIINDSHFTLKFIKANLSFFVRSKPMTSLFESASKT
jgi:hypothetical protein